MSDQTYTDRQIDTVTITAVDPIKHTAWFDNPPPDELAAVLAVGDTIDIERRGTTITGWRHRDRWWLHKSDQDLEREHQEFCAEFDRQRREELERNRDEWERRTCALPDWLQARIRHFIQQGGENFALNGWGYELVVCELAALFTAPDFDDNDEVSTYCREQGLTGHMHGVARVLARAHHNGESLAGTVSALAPITGDPDYSAGF